MGGDQKDKSEVHDEVYGPRRDHSEARRGPICRLLRKSRMRNARDRIMSRYLLGAGV